MDDLREDVIDAVARAGRFAYHDVVRKWCEMTLDAVAEIDQITKPGTDDRG